MFGKAIIVKYIGQQMDYTKHLALLLVYPLGLYLAVKLVQNPFHIAVERIRVEKVYCFVFFPRFVCKNPFILDQLYLFQWIYHKIESPFRFFILVKLDSQGLSQLLVFHRAFLFQQNNSLFSHITNVRVPSTFTI